MYTTLLTGLQVLERVAQSSMPRGVTELAAELQMPKSNVHRMLQTLEHAGYLKRSTSGQYSSTLKMWDMASRVAERIDVPREAHVQMQKLSDLTQETIHLGILENGEVSYIDLIQSRLPVRVHIGIGQRAPAHCVSTGKAMLAFASPKTVEDVCKQLKRYTGLTVTNPDSFRASLKKVKGQGYVISRGEYREDVCGIGVPIFDRTGAVVAALGISGPSERLSDSALKRFAPPAIESANRISQSLGYGSHPFTRAA